MTVVEHIKILILSTSHIYIYIQCNFLELKTQTFFKLMYVVHFCFSFSSLVFSNKKCPNGQFHCGNKYVYHLTLQTVFVIDFICIDLFTTGNLFCSIFTLFKKYSILLYFQVLFWVYSNR